jgi:uncharacterized protein
MTCELAKPVRAVRFLFLLLLLITAEAASGQRPVPELWGLRVHDEARVLTQQTVQQLESQLKQFEDSTTNQLAILIIPSLNGEVLEEYALRVAEYWKLGQQDRDNGVLLLIAVEDRKVRIEVGYGLEGVLTDAVCNQIIRNVIVPNFRRSDYDAGVLEGIQAIMQAASGEFTVAEGVVPGELGMNGREKALISLFVFTVLGIFTFIGLKMKGGQAWFLYFFLIPFYAVFPGSLFGFDTGLWILGAYLVSWPLLKIYFNRRGWSTFENRGGSSSGGGWYSGGGGWSSGGGGFSGGGGSFGGGGSSGSW